MLPGTDLYADPGAGCTDFRGATIVRGAGHWVHQEAPSRPTAPSTRSSPRSELEVPGRALPCARRTLTGGRMANYIGPSANGPRRLRELLDAGDPVLAPGVYDALGARLVEEAGFDAAYMTGFGTAASMLGRPDVGLVTMSEMVDNARRIARACAFPKASNGSILDPFLPNKRQDNVFDTRNGYFSNDPLGLWVAVWVVYTPKAFTSQGRKELDPIAATNGRDLDGTPILTSPSQLDNLADKGLIEFRTRPVDDPVFRWVICPIPEDPRDGFIRPDAFIRDVRRADDRSVFPALRKNFDCLQRSGDWCD